MGRLFGASAHAGEITGLPVVRLLCQRILIFRRNEEKPKRCDSTAKIAASRSYDDSKPVSIDDFIPLDESFSRSGFRRARVNKCL